MTINWTKITHHTVAENLSNGLADRAKRLKDAQLALVSDRIIEGVQNQEKTPIVLAILAEALNHKKTAEQSLSTSSKEILH